MSFGHEGTLWPWMALLLLGAFHGLNPGMGWLFAVALGIQEQRRRAVWQALFPLALGHGLAIAATILVVILAGAMVSSSQVKLLVAGILISFGLYRFFRHCNPRAGGMKVGLLGLTTWSFLMASAHGAGLMVLPVFLGITTNMPCHEAHSAHLQGVPGPLTGLLATLVHGGGYLLVTAIIAVIVFEKLGVGLLRKAWINLDLLWSTALIATGSLALTV